MEAKREREEKQRVVKTAAATTAAPHSETGSRDIVLRLLRVFISREGEESQSLVFFILPLVGL